MSRIGKQNIEIPSSVEVSLEKQTIKVKGPKGELKRTISDLMEIEINKSYISLIKKEDSRKAQQLYGLSRTLLNNLIVGVSQGFTKKLEVSGVGYRSQMDGKKLILNMGYSHPVVMQPPEEILIKVEKNNSIIISGIDKELVGQIASNIRNVRPPEPYKGKGIRYENEVIRRKVGKAGKGK